MEVGGGRTGRASRYSSSGPTTVFTGPVRRWKKKWIHVSKNNNNYNNNNNNHHQTTAKTDVKVNGGVNGSNNGDRLLLLKWTPINGKNGDGNKNDVGVNEDSRKRKFKYIPIALLEEQNNEMSEQDEDEVEPIEPDANIREPTLQAGIVDEKPDINDVPMEENQAPQNKPPERQDLNESTLDLSLGLTAHEDNDSGSKANQADGKLDRV